MKKLLILVAMCIGLTSILVGCSNTTDNHPSQIAPMRLSDSQQQIVDLVTGTGQEILLFDYNLNGMFNSIKVWVEILRYGEPLGKFAGLHILGNPAFPLSDGQLAIAINWHANNEFRWMISAGSGRSNSESWIADSDSLARAFGPIVDATPIEDGREILLYISKFTDGPLRSTNDLQNYLLHPEALAGYTYVHLIKARFSQNPQNCKN